MLILRTTVIMRLLLESSSKPARQIPPSYGDALSTKPEHSLRGVDRVPQAHLSPAPIVPSRRDLRTSAAEIASIRIVVWESVSRLRSFQVLGGHR